MNNKTKLLITIPNLYGGTGTFCRNLAYGLKKYFPDQYSVELLTLDSKDIAEEDYELFDKINILHSCASDDLKRFIKVFIHWYKVRKKINNIQGESQTNQRRKNSRRQE